MDPDNKLGNGRKAAVESLRHDKSFIDLLATAFDLLCERSGNLKVAAELEEYQLELEGRFTTGNAHYEQVREDRQQLEDLLAQLQADG